MARYEATLMHGERGGEGRYAFDATEDLMALTPVKVIRTFMDYLEKTRGEQIGHIDFEINGALKNAELGIVTGMGQLVLQDGVQPFVVFINRV